MAFFHIIFYYEMLGTPKFRQKACISKVEHFEIIIEIMDNCAVWWTAFQFLTHRAFSFTIVVSDYPIILQP